MTPAATLYVPGQGGLYGVSGRVKLLAVVVASSGLMFIDSILALLVFSVVLAATTAVYIKGIRAFVHAMLWPSMFSLGVLAAHVLVSQADTTFMGWVAALRLFCVLLMARLLMMTTLVSDMIDALTWALMPLQWLGGNPRRVAVLCGLTLRFIPVLGRVMAQVREAHKARGGSGWHVGLIIPFLVRSLRLALSTGEALDARGWNTTRYGNDRA